MNPEHEFHGPNLAYMQGLRERYQTDPESLDPATREYFRAHGDGGDRPGLPASLPI